MASIGLHTNEQWVALIGVATANDLLQSGNVLERVKRHHAVVVVGGEHKDGRVLDTGVSGWANVVQGRVAESKKRRYFYSSYI